MRKHRPRAGVTLVELLVGMAILTAIGGMMIGAIQRVRAEAVRVSSANKLRQILIATHNWSAARNGRLPAYPAPVTPDVRPLGEPVLIAILPYLAGATGVAKNPQVEDGYYVPSYLNPADPTWADASYGDTVREGNCGYAVNYQVFRVGAVLPACCPDGTAGTVAFGERYARCLRTGTYSGSSVQVCHTEDDAIVQCVNPWIRRPTFVDPVFDDVKSVTVGGVTLPSVAGVTFQVRPSPEQCDYRQLQTPHPGGMLTAYLDGSVRTTSPGVTPAVFWSAVTPAGGEVTPPE